MRHITTKTLVAFVTFILASVTTMASPSVDTITIQGYMKKPAGGGAVTDGTYNIAFGVCKTTCTVGANVVWVKKISTVVASGLFSVDLSGLGDDLSADGTVVAGSNLQVNKSAVGLTPATIAGIASGAVKVRAYAASTIDGNNPQFDISLNSVPTAYYAGVAATLDNGSGAVIPSNWTMPASQLTGAVATATNFSGSLAGDVTGTQGATVVGKLNGVSLAGLGTGILKNTTGTGVPSIAVAIDFPTLNQNTTGSAASLGGATFAAPGAIGGTTPGSAAFTTLSASGAVSGAGIVALHAAPGPIGSTTASTGAFTTLSASGAVSGAGFSGLLAAPSAIGSTTPSTGAFTTLSATGAVSGAGIVALHAAPGPIGSTTASTGAFTTLSTTGTISPAAATSITGAGAFTVQPASGSALTVGQAAGASNTTVQSGATGNLTMGAAGGITTLGSVAAVGNSTVITSGSTGKVTIGAGGLAFTNMGTCVVGSTAWTTAVITAKTCTGVATASIVHCSGATAVTGQAFNVFATAANTVSVVASAAGTTVLNCFYITP